MGNAQRATAFLGFCLTLSAFVPRPAAAVDGVIEINQARALAGGVTATDTPGFPVTIDASGSYKLTGNLTVPNENTTAILVTTAAAAVDIDLNGFGILGGLTCTVPPTSACSPSGGSGSGIDRQGTSASRLRVTHGAIRGMGSFGVTASGMLVLEGVEAIYNGFTGIRAGNESQVTNCEVSRNHEGGIQVGTDSTVLNCVAKYNGSSGIEADDGSVVEHNEAASNGGFGIFAALGCAVSGNTASNNAGYGILVGGGSTVLDNTARNNGFKGLDFTGVGGYARNVLTGNNGGSANAQVAGTGIELGTNICGTDTVCP